MDLDFWVRVFDRLLPRSRLWSLIFDRTLRKFFHGLSILPQLIHNHLASIVLEAFPSTTTRADDWSRFFGSAETLSVTEIEAHWAATGGQSPRYMEDILQAAGFDVYIHEWWEPGTNPPVARNPIALAPTSRVLVNDINHIEKLWVNQFGAKPTVKQFQGDAEIRFGDFNGYHWVPKRYPTPDVPTEYPTYYYICGETWPDFAIIPEEGLRELLHLIYKMKPVHLRVILRVTLACESDIQDSISATDEIQDVISGTDAIQDVIESEC